MLRIIYVAVAFLTLTAILIPVQWLAVRFRWRLRRAIPVFFHRTVCKLLGVRITVGGRRADAKQLLIAANHSSWLDIPVLTTLAPMVFVAKREVSTWPLFGLLARLQRTVFVDRERRAKVADTADEMAARLAEGDPVVLFAEGTSNDGNRVLPFRSSLIGAAHAAMRSGGGTVTVQPLALVYTHLSGLPTGRIDRPRVAWYGDMDLLPHLGGIVRTGAVDATIVWGTPIEVGPDTDRKVLTIRLENDVRRLAAEARRA
ncbi:2-acyl-glycerophospho-ethanolamine acyltransferase [Variibacter gotjawalensis]|uniref:2-acyl-glycerophospho-ethanolamine acyltransferase n=1 Tax=Variibacter gotjawalensis TaxID=1333996 RepID=A0A0S3PQ27_9BRAD|nr:lysophospholipid acyltransferase family protein [Variibacter gotjawalensis]NIK48335.1 1-acyl-sn-glycerol-3-phosphate acyltransferase [Variibacter gotjawalensis]RZS50205.1 lyso-ornithine lipid acyltransferase [Variibacter gotjawalensis]BAT58036.1 2-acyl-glycerophospho-ethanolamine acyltransferase [Variibacter gotjawalensis]